MDDIHIYIYNDPEVDIYVFYLPNFELRGGNILCTIYFCFIRRIETVPYSIYFRIVIYTYVYTRVFCWKAFLPF